MRHEGARHKSTKRVQVIGIGSGIGLDEIGWRVVDRLAAMALESRLPGVQFTFENCAVPAQLPTRVRGVDLLVLIDALPEAGQPVTPLDAHELAGIAAQCSSHGVDLAQALALLPLTLADPPRIRIYGIGVAAIDGVALPPVELEELVADVIDPLLRLLQRDLS